MKSLLIAGILFLIMGSLFAQQSLAPICEVDYYNASRYSGARNIARTTNGDLIVVFEPGGNYTGGSQEIHYVTYNWIFGSWDPPVALSQSATNSTGVPAVVANESGQVYATWKEKNANEKRDLMFSQWNAGTWSPPVVADTIDNNTGVNTVNLAPDGTIYGIFSIWNDPPVFDANIYVSHSSDNGATWVTDNLTPVFPTPNSLPINFLDVDISPGKNGKMYAAWEDKPQPLTNQYEVLMSEYDPGSGWNTPEVLTPINDGPPALAKYVDGCTPTGDAVSVYQMGPASYVFAGLSSMIYKNNGTSEALSACFNPFYIQPGDDGIDLMNDLLSSFGITAQSSVLVVDDDNKYNNENLIWEALDSLGVPYDTFSCGNAGGMATRVPTFASDLQNKDLVIWFTGDDLNNLAFWNINDEDNPELITYLNTQGKKLWVVGRDWLYDRYGAAADTFQAGDFCYDYLGISSYDVQSYRDEGWSGGVPQLDLVPGNGIASVVDPIGWGNAGTRQGEPSLATDGSGNLHMAYYDAANGEHILYTKFDGATWSAPVQVDASLDTVDVQRPNIAVDPNYGVYIIWMQQTDTTIYNVFYATSPDGGVTWNAPQQLSNCSYVNSSGYSVKNPTIGRKVRDAMAQVNFDGGAEVVWTEASQSSAMGYYLMYARIPYEGTLPVGIGDSQPQTALSYELSPNYPNPFNAETVFRFSIPRREKVKLDIYNVTGQRVAELVNGKMTAGKHLYRWNAAEMPTGVYFAVLKSGGFKQVRKVMLVK